MLANKVLNLKSKIEKVLRGIQGEKSRKDTRSVKLVSTIGAQDSFLKITKMLQ